MPIFPPSNTIHIVQLSWLNTVAGETYIALFEEDEGNATRLLVRWTTLLDMDYIGSVCHSLSQLDRPNH